MVECATVCVKSEVILLSQSALYKRQGWHSEPSLAIKFLQLFSAQVERPSPEKTSTVLSTHLFLWFDKTVWKGLRRTINVEDLWDLNPSDRSAFSPNF